MVRGGDGGGGGQTGGNAGRAFLTRSQELGRTTPSSLSHYLFHFSHDASHFEITYLFVYWIVHEWADLFVY